MNARHYLCYFPYCSPHGHGSCMFLDASGFLIAHTVLKVKTPSPDPLSSPPAPCAPAEEGEYFLKVLIPSYAAGSIIGKGGQTIVQLQKETGATIKLSKSKDFYPGEPWPRTVP